MINVRSFTSKKYSCCLNIDKFTYHNYLIRLRNLCSIVIETFSNFEIRTWNSWMYYQTICLFSNIELQKIVMAKCLSIFNYLEPKFTCYVINYTNSCHFNYYCVIIPVNLCYNRLLMCIYEVMYVFWKICWSISNIYNEINENLKWSSLLIL